MLADAGSLTAGAQSIFAPKTKPTIPYRTPTHSKHYRGLFVTKMVRCTKQIIGLKQGEVKCFLVRCNILIFMPFFDP